MHTHTHIAPLLQFHVAHKVQNSECCTNTFCCAPIHSVAVQPYNCMAHYNLMGFAGGPQTRTQLQQRVKLISRDNALVCVCVCASVFASVCMLSQIFMHTCMRTYMHVHIHACARTCIQVCLYACMNTCIHPYACTYNPVKHRPSSHVSHPWS